MTKNESNDPILLDKEGYAKFLEGIEKIKTELAENDVKKGKACSDAVGDGMHDNFEYDDLARREVFLTNQLKERYEQLKRVKIVEKTDNEDLIEAGDFLLIDMVSATGNVKEYKVKLVASFDFAMEKGIKLATLDSPLGKAIYHKCVGDKVSYSVNGKSFEVKIKARIKEETEEKENENTGKVK